jgi:hypothetical protein
MADLIPIAEDPTWVPQIHQRPAGEPLTGGAPDLAADQGFANVQAQQLAKRTSWLKGVVDPLDLAAWKNANCPASFGSSGYQVLKSGLIIQWGNVSNVGPGDAGAVTSSFPISFPNDWLKMVVSRATGTSQPVANMVATGTDTTKSTFKMIRPSDGAGSLSFQWIAIGH